MVPKQVPFCTSWLKQSKLMYWILLNISICFSLRFLSIWMTVTSASLTIFFHGRSVCRKHVLVNIGNLNFSIYNLFYRIYALPGNTGIFACLVLMFEDLCYFLQMLPSEYLQKASSFG